MENYEDRKTRSANLRLLFEALVVGLVSGVVVGSFRWLIGETLTYWKKLYQLASQNPQYFALIAGLLLASILIAGFLVKQQPHAGGSGIPEVELQLQGKLRLSWWPILWRKFIGGVLSIGSGLFLGREGPSIQLGSTVGQGVAQGFKASKTDARVLLATGAASGLSAAFGAPMGGAMFIVEEVFHNFSPRVWLNALAGAIMANFVVSNVFGQTPVLAISYNHSFPILQYWHLLLLGIFLGLVGRFYQWGLFSFNKFYEKIPLPRWLHGLIPAAILIPIMYFYPDYVGGGNTLILGLDQIHVTKILVMIFLLRIAFSIVSYDSGLPGGIFLPILTMGALLGAIYGHFMADLGLLDQKLVVNLVIFSMAGLFAAIVRSPFTAIMLIAEMVGSLLHRMPLAVVSVMAYITNELAGGEPIYESLAGRMQTKEDNDYVGEADQLTFSVFEGSQMAGKKIKEIAWPDRTLVKVIHRGQKDIIPDGNTQLVVGDLVVLELDENQRGVIYDEVARLQNEK
ncbi:chloride channel protein [Lactobacillus delbrueckii]|uniref:ClC family H(+)/Cl(-) exchange transporter n=1 Tax=Lactobacillus delbrueckii TaxID=1584 RepID=UPI001F42859A|nr:ClC family H(+)/Cl(-) exchange transporter [Lactobacillus delbrueckii]GHN32580.1 chloride channel protein [Lactobacillus delbrueckii]